MSKYTVEQVEACILAYRNGDLNYCRAGIIALLTAYAATLKAAQGGVTDQTLREMCRAYETTAHGFADFTPNERGLQAMRAALEAALSAQQGQGEADLAGYVDPEQVADMQRNGGGVSIGSFSERYGRTVPVYFHPAPPEEGAVGDTVTVDAAALREVLQALIGPAHLIRELQVTRGLPIGSNPIDLLVRQFNEQQGAAR